MNPRPLLVSAAVLGFLGVALGAFGAHALKDVLVAPEQLDRWHTASQYHQIHAVAALLAVVLKAPRAGWLFITGTIIFSGSLYLMALTGKTWLGAITPIGGVCYLVGWAWIAVQAYRSSGAESGLVG